MKRLIATIILAIIAIAIAGCDFTYQHVRHHRPRGHAPRAIIVTRAPVYYPPPHGHGHHIPPGHYPGRHGRRY